MNIRIFNRNYWIRRFGFQKIVKGYLASGYKDFVASIHVHPLSTDQVKALPEGERKLKRLEGHGEVALVTGDEKANRKGDLLYYHGDWYECVSSQMWDHTLLAHYNYQFVLVPTDTGKATDLKPPKGNPVNPTTTPPDPDAPEVPSDDTGETPDDTGDGTNDPPAGPDDPLAPPDGTQGGDEP